MTESYPAQWVKFYYIKSTDTQLLKNIGKSYRTSQNAKLNLPLTKGINERMKQFQLSGHELDFYL